MEEDDFTFPTVAAEAPEGRLGRGDDGDPVVARPLQLPLPDLAAAAPLWPFAVSPKAAVPSPSSSPVARDEEPREGPVSGSNGREQEHRAAAAEEGEERDEERMDLLWVGGSTTATTTTSTTAPAPRSTGSGGGYAEPPPNPKQRQQRQSAESDGDKQRAAAVADAERMDKLWESFNEELLLLRRSRSKSAAAGNRPGGTDWYLCSYPPSDAESEGTSASSPAERRGYGCAPTMLRASSRAGGAGQFCGSPRRRRSGAAGGWALLLRLFRRLFAVDKAPAPSSSRSHATVYVP